MYFVVHFMNSLIKAIASKCFLINSPPGSHNANYSSSSGSMPNFSRERYFLFEQGSHLNRKQFLEGFVKKKKILSVFKCRGLSCGIGQKCEGK